MSRYRIQHVGGNPFERSFADEIVKRGYVQYLINYDK